MAMKLLQEGLERLQYPTVIQALNSTSQGKKLLSAGVPVNIAETLTGHSSGNVHELYVHKELISMKTLQEGLEKLQYSQIFKLLFGQSMAA